MTTISIDLISYLPFFSDIPATQQNQFAWHPSGEMHISVGQGTVPIDTRNHKQENEDVEVMSTDSSSSSSSNSE